MTIEMFVSLYLVFYVLLYAVAWWRRDHPFWDGFLQGPWGLIYQAWKKRHG